MSGIQDDASKGAAVIEKDTTPWYAEGWYKPGVVIGLVSIAALGVAPWAGDNASRVSGSAVALIFIGALITIVYAFLSDAYGATAKKVEKAERDIRIDWAREASSEHCKRHCECSYCRGVRLRQPLKGIES